MLLLDTGYITGVAECQLEYSLHLLIRRCACRHVRHHQQYSETVSCLYCLLPVHTHNCSSGYFQMYLG